MRARDFSIIEKQIGETPLAALERFRHEAGISAEIPMAYAGRLDPMASGKLLILIGQECKRQQDYHGLDKEYEFEVLFGVRSDTGDVLGIVEACPSPRSDLGFGSESGKRELKDVCKKLEGKIELPYPHFSSKTVRGKPLHTWTLEDRLNEIEIPTYTAHIYKLQLLGSYEVSYEELYSNVMQKIETIPPVTDERKAIGNDFRRPAVHASWNNLKTKWEVQPPTPTSQKVQKSGVKPLTQTTAKFRCTCSAGTYMRTLAEVIANELNTCGLAYSIHRTKIGRYQKLPFNFGFWKQSY